MARHQSEVSHAILDHESRLEKAQKLCALLSDFVELSDVKLLDIGVGAGIITRELARRCRSVHGVDVVDERVVSDGYEFHLVSDERLPFDRETFDVVVSNHVAPHVRDQQAHFDELYRVLRPGGYAYVAVPNRWFDGNYRLPLLSVLPRPAAERYFRLVYGREYDVRPLSYAALHRLLARFSDVRDVSARALRDPERYHLGERLSALAPVLEKVPEPAFDALAKVLPTFIVVAKK